MTEKQEKSNLKNKSKYRIVFTLLLWKEGGKMKIDKEPLKVIEKYIIEKNDILEIKSKGEITEIFINGKRISFVTKVKFTQEVGERPTIEIERLFQSEDFEEIKKFY